MKRKKRKNVCVSDEEIEIDNNLIASDFDDVTLMTIEEEANKIDKDVPVKRY
jgi:aryl carrier-like protein